MPLCLKGPSKLSIWVLVQMSFMNRYVTNVHLCSTANELEPFESYDAHASSIRVLHQYFIPHSKSGKVIDP